VADVARFFDMTRGHVLMAGPRTIGAVPQFARADRTLVTLRSGDDPQAMLDRFPGRVVYIGVVRRCGTSTPASSATGTSLGCRTTGPADRWFDPRWLLTGVQVRSH